MLASLYYHRLHAVQLRVLHELTGIAAFADARGAVRGVRAPTDLTGRARSPKRPGSSSVTTDAAVRRRLVVGARPNFVKAAALYRAFRRSEVFRVRIVHTGQHYDERWLGPSSGSSELPAPDAALNVGSGSHAVPDGASARALRT